MEKRLESIDVLRGFDMFFIMGLTPVVTRLCDALGITLEDIINDTTIID